jgi:hypothetical protein
MKKKTAIGWYDHETSQVPEKIQLEVTMKLISALVDVLHLVE